MRRRAAAAWPFVLLALAYVLTAWRVVGSAALRDPAVLYWRDWQDQALYLRSARALAAGDLAATEHYYPLLYPMLGMPFLQVWPGQPFFLVDLVCYLLAFAGFRSVAQAFGLPGRGALLLFAATTLGQFGIAKLWIEPWTTTPSAALLWLALGAMARMWGQAHARRGPALVLGIALGLIPFARPGDAPLAAMIAVAAGIALYRAGDRRAVFVAVASCAAVVAVPGLVYLAIYGAHPSAYMLYSAQYGFNVAWVGWKAYVLLVDPRAWFGEGVGLLEHAPWLLLGGAGVIASVWSPPERRPVALAAAAVAIVHTVLMLAYVDLLPTGLWRFNNVHYFKWELPLFGLFGVRFLLDARRRPVLLAAAVPVLLACAIRLDPVRIGDDMPARMVVFPAPLGAEWTPTYFATAWTTDRTGEQRNAFDYHQILVAGRVRVVALRRAFTGDERWIGDDHVLAQLEGRPTGGYAPLYLTGPWPKRPVARYGMKVSLGLPDWFRGAPASPTR